MADKKLTKRQLKQLVRSTSIEEVISGLDLEMAKHAINIKEQDLVDVADMVQTYEGLKVDRLKKLLLGTEMHVFHNFVECQIPPKTRINIILIDDVYIVKVQKT